ncbi:hypothetical protein [Paracoccus sp. (in: a-proteobacteria)]|uniref:hypothetical protein n=1 Tax=Paracoccus sp. TaxID=267 RepID=UPI002AFFA924|nr:hypothetical protein [Paracoccus sp. (in: a-proteobacteria)]
MQRQVGGDRALLPLYDNRFFSNVAQIFEAKARANGLTPLVSSTGRDPVIEQRTLEDLASYALDGLLICGTTNPDAWHGSAAKPACPCHHHSWRDGPFGGLGFPPLGQGILPQAFSAILNTQEPY